MCEVQYVSVLPSFYQRNGGSQVCTEGDPELKEFQADKALRRSGVQALTSGSETISRRAMFQQDREEAEGDRDGHF